MTTDRAHIRRIRQAMAQLLQARGYQRQAARMVREAETALKAALVAVGQQPPSDDGNKAAA